MNSVRSVAALEVPLKQASGVEVQAGNLPGRLRPLPMLASLREGLVKADRHSVQAAFDVRRGPALRAAGCGNCTAKNRLNVEHRTEPGEVLGEPTPTAARAPALAGGEVLSSEQQRLEAEGHPELASLLGDYARRWEDYRVPVWRRDE